MMTSHYDPEAPDLTDICFRSDAHRISGPISVFWKNDAAAFVRLAHVCANVTVTVNYITIVAEARTTCVFRECKDTQMHACCTKLYCRLLYTTRQW
eukprot:4877655-Pleurochrysis_carterae.AAC.1